MRKFEAGIIALDALKAIDVKVDALIEQTCNEINALEEQLAEVDARIDEEKKKMQLAEERLDAAAYSEARQKLDTYTIQQSMISKALEKRKTGLIISEDEIQSLVRDVNSSLTNLANDTDEKLAVKSREMRDEAIELHDALKMAERIVRKIKTNLDHRDDRVKTYTVASVGQTLRWSSAGMADRKYASYDDMKKYPSTIMGQKDFFATLD